MTKRPACLVWERPRKRLWIVQGRRLISWPEGKSYGLPLKDDGSPVGNDLGFFITASPKGDRMLLNREGTAWVIDLRTGSVRWKRSRIQRAWWSSGAVSWLGEAWKEQQSLYRAGRRVRLSRGASLGAIDERFGYAIGRLSSLAALSSPRLLKVNLATGATTAVQKALSISEYETQDSIEWNPRLGRAIVTYSGDTGGTTATLEILSETTAHGFEGLRFLESRPEWFGDSVLANLRTFWEETSKGGYDRYQLELIDGRTDRETVLISRTAYFSMREGDNRRDTMPRVTLASGLFEQRLIAYVEWTGKRWQVVIAKLISGS